SSGNIGATALDTFAYSGTGVTGDLINISGTTYAVAYRGPSGVGRVLTFSIAADGTTTGGLDASDFDDTNCTYPRILNVSGDVYVIAYQGTDDDGFAKTMTIDSDGTISAVIDALEFETTNCLYVDMVSVTGDTYAVVYWKSSSSGNLVTFTVSSAGAFSAVLGTSEFESTTFGAWPSVITISSTIICVAYQGVDIDGFAKTFFIDGLPLAVTTQTCEAVVGVTATGRGNITNLGNSSVTAHGHVWGTSLNPTTGDSSVDNGAASATGAFTSDLTALIPGTVYYTRAYAINSVGTSYGANVRFTAALTRAGIIWMEGSNFRGFDENAIEGKYIRTADVD
ncbi:hypothetical protein LCGC14_3133070, partial [marine sediment metagenome]